MSIHVLVADPLLLQVTGDKQEQESSVEATGYPYILSSTSIHADLSIWVVQAIPTVPTGLN
jgi:hypothetical protein